MNPAAWVAIVGVVLALLVQAVGLVIWGARLTQRVKSLEAEVEPLKQLTVQFARMDVKLDNIIEQFKDLTANLRWMRSDQVPAYQPRPMPPGTVDR